MPPGYGHRYKVKIKSFQKSTDGSYWNFRLEVYDRDHPMFDFSSIIHEFDVHFSGDKEGLRRAIHEELRKLANDSTLYKIKEVLEVLEEFEGR